MRPGTVKFTSSPAGAWSSRAVVLYGRPMRSGRHARALTAVATVAAVAAGCADGAPDADQGMVARGEQLYAASCVQCHGGPTGGQISDIPPRHNAEGHTWHHSDCLLAEIVLDGLPPRPGATGDQVMPAYRDELTEADVEAILAFLKTWWTDEQRSSQAETTATDCTDR